MAIPSLLRLEEHRIFRTLRLDGSIVDIGGDVRSAYRTLLGGDHTITTINNNAPAQPDINHDLELPLPVPDNTYDHALLINILEHIYEYRQLLAEAHRILRPGGSVVIMVPFMFPFHPSPDDFWRFTISTLERDIVKSGFRVEHIEPLGRGVFAAQYIFLDRLLPTPIRFCNFWTLRYVFILGDTLFATLARVLGKKYRTSDYALGYYVAAKKV